MENIDELLWGVLEGTDVPSVAAAAVIDGKLHAAGAVGIRKRGDDTPVTVNDRYHIGSCTKAMTATLAGILVERGVITWETRLKDVFPDMAIHPGYEPVTVRQLLSHTAGFPAFTNPDDEDEELVRLLEINTGEPMAERSESLLPEVLRRAPRSPLGQFAYSNMGYIVAGAVLEQLTKTPFETLLQREIFSALGMTSAGFGAAGTPGQLDEPCGHSPEPIEPGPEADNPPLLSPAGTVHMYITDFARHAAFHLTGEPRLVSQATLALLHTPVKDSYALGWGGFRA